MKKVLLTGITGFLGSHTAIQLLNKGYEVIGTLRDMNRAVSIKEVIGKHTDNMANLKLKEADISDAKIWVELTRSVDYVQHIASPFPRILPKNENDLLIPAKNGVLNILRAAAANGVKRVVFTSSTAAMLYGKPKHKRSGTFDESTWTDASKASDLTAYFKSKTLAERAAWEFIAADKSGLELTSVLPSAIVGPVLEADFGTSANIVIKPLDGSMPAIPQIGFDMVDVRSVADLLIRAMEKPEAANQRYAGAGGFMRFREVVDVLKKEYPQRKLPSKTIPNFAVRLFSKFDKTLKPILLDLSVERKVDNSKAKIELGWEPISNEQSVLDCAESVMALGIVK